MKKAADTQVSSEPKGRFTGWGVLGLSVAVALVTFLVLGPFVERNAHLEALNDLEDQERLKRGLLVLCNTEGNVQHLNAQLMSKTLAERNRVTPMARALSCIGKLKPELRAEYYLWHGEPGEGVSRAVGEGNWAIEPAIEALTGESEEVRLRAMHALMALADELNADQVARVARRLQPEDRSAVAQALRVALKLPLPAEPVVTPPAVVAPPVVVSVEADQGAPVEDGEEAADMERRDQGDMSVVDEADEGVKLGAGGLRLNLDLLGGSPRQGSGTPGRGPQLREPSLSPPPPRQGGGVLFERGE